MECDVSDSMSHGLPNLKEIYLNSFSEETYRKGLSFQPRSTDVIIPSAPKCGTTWVQQIVHQLRTGGDMDFASRQEEIPFVEAAYDFGYDLEGEQKAEPRYTLTLYCMIFRGLFLTGKVVWCYAE